MTAKEIVNVILAEYARRKDSRGAMRFMMGYAIGALARQQLDRGDFRGARETWAMLARIA